jgi:hypothetical protein
VADWPEPRIQTGQWPADGLYFVLVDLGCDVADHQLIYTGSVGLVQVMQDVAAHEASHPAGATP